MVRVRVAPVLGAIASLALGTPVRAGPAPDRDVQIVVVANAAASGDAISAAQLRRMYLRRERYWHNGKAVVPVNLPLGTPLRDAFSRAVLGRAPEELSSYWNELYFHGTMPPATVASQSAVLLFVSRTPGAIGYVSRDSLGAVGGGAEVRVLLTLSATSR